MTKGTPLQKYIFAIESAKLDAREASAIEIEQTLRAETDLTLSPEQRLDIFKGLQAWPRIVLGLYEAELAIAQNDRKENGDTEHTDEPSDIAYDAVGEAIDLGPDRVRNLCREGRAHRQEGMPTKPKISAAEFKKLINGCHAIQGEPTD